MVATSEHVFAVGVINVFWIMVSVIDGERTGWKIEKRMCTRFDFSTGEQSEPKNS